MKVLVDNSLVSRFTYPFRQTCVKCKSVLEVEQGDVVEEPATSAWARAYGKITCTVCHFEQLARADSPDPLPRPL